jgi:hypothetical protein
MSTNNKKSTLTQALLEMEEITSAIKEESKKSLNALLSEAVRDAIRESCNEDEEEEYEVTDDEKNDAIDTENETDDTASLEDEGEAVETGEDVHDEEPSSDIEATQEEPVDGEGEEDWNEFEKYQVGDNTYDLTGENDYESVVKVYKLLKDEDQVVIRKDGNKIQLKDDTVGTEYVIDLGGDGETAEVESSEEDFDSLNEDITYHDEFDPIWNLQKKGVMGGDSDIAGFEGEDDGIEMDFDDEPEMTQGPSDRELSNIERDLDFSDLDDDYDEYYGDEELFESRNNKNNKNARKPMKESKEVLFEVDLGYTDNYQAKDPIAGLSNNEPSKKGKSWHKGVPTGTQKPWAGETKSKGEPFEKTVNEEEMPDMGVETPVEEGATSVSSQSVAKETNTRTSGPRRNNARMVAKNVSTAEKGYEEVVNENKRLKAENKVLKETLLSLKKNLSEAYVTNVNLGKITKLFLENTTSQTEKADIINRFSNEAKTVEQSNALYESIKRELNKNVNTQMNINESMTKANAETINETTYKSAELLKSIDLMNRMGC